MFNSGLRESITNEVELLDGTVDAFRLLLEYIYSGEMEINSKDIREVIEILSLAHKYDLTALIAPMEKFLQSSLSILNFAAIYSTSLYYSLPNLTNACMSFIVDHSVEIIKTDEFVELPAKCLEPFMMLMSQHTPIEYVVAGLTIWLDANPHQLKAFQFVLDVLGLALIKDETRVRIVKYLATIPAERWLSYEEMSNST
ncbi:BTB/POZ domain-containing protein [Ditylenchus destructor]|uniref:BTB/POZ domain-containing protein n=1 Tax=Ditylenchus destructor TaxID=166010 RepID=A0AAD4RBI0_9BILA|nr:BTB/POZ domain-containing protein [Ditylenchus destructor]